MVRRDSLAILHGNFGLIQNYAETFLRLLYLRSHLLGRLGCLYFGRKEAGEKGRIFDIQQHFLASENGWASLHVLKSTGKTTSWLRDRRYSRRELIGMETLL